MVNCTVEITKKYSRFELYIQILTSKPNIRSFKLLKLRIIRRKLTLSVANHQLQFRKSEREIVPDFGVIQVHLLRPSEKQSPTSFHLSLLCHIPSQWRWEFDKLSRKTLFPFEEDATLLSSKRIMRVLCPSFRKLEKACDNDLTTTFRLQFGNCV